VYCRRAGAEEHLSPYPGPHPGQGTAQVCTVGAQDHHSPHPGPHPGQGTAQMCTEGALESIQSNHSISTLTGSVTFLRIGIFCSFHFMICIVLIA
jgi:hypothetical protein